LVQGRLGVTFRFTEFSEDEMRRPTPYAVPFGGSADVRRALKRPSERRIGPPWMVAKCNQR